MTNEDLSSLLTKFDIPTPRYTSYPTVPYWEASTIDQEKWLQSVVKQFVNEKRELSIYIHLPFCEHLCTFCACNKRITKNHEVEGPYIQAVLEEWGIYKQNLPFAPIVKEIHLGGGTPTFFSPNNLQRLIQGILKDSQIATDHEFSIEVHPNFTTEEHLKVLAEIGFNRISLGVQDFSPEVQYVINRIQTFEQTKQVADWAKKYHYKSLNIDLVYGLPKQKVEDVVYTIKKIHELLPDRIAYYSYAHVPWKSKVQRRYTDEDLPKAAEKLTMYKTGKELLESIGYQAIGMDHFALTNDKLFEMEKIGKLHRNFMGYTTTQSKLLIGLGASSISDAWNAFVQNDKTVETYQASIADKKLPIVNGHLLNQEDLLIRQHILDLMCRHQTTLNPEQFDNIFLNSALEKLKLLAKDGLISLEGYHIKVEPKGYIFIRNICAAIDARLWRESHKGSTFSKAI